MTGMTAVGRKWGIASHARDLTPEPMAGVGR